MSKNPYEPEFTGRKRIVVVWVKRVSIGSSDWDPIACKTSKDAANELRRARKSGYMAFVATYKKVKAGKSVASAEREAEFHGDE